MGGAEEGGWFGLCDGMGICCFGFLLCVFVRFVAPAIFSFSSRLGVGDVCNSVPGVETVEK